MRSAKKTSVPGMPVALPPWSLIMSTRPGLILPPRVCSTIAIGLRGGDAEAADEPRLEAGLLHGGGDRLAAAVDDDRVDAGDLEEDDVAHRLRTSSWSSIAEPPILMRKVLPRKAWR